MTITAGNPDSFHSNAVPNSSKRIRSIVETSFQLQATADSAVGKVQPPPPIQPVSERFPALEEQEIIFTHTAPEAREVTVAGKFNAWSPDATPLKKTGPEEWTVRLLLRSGQYEYRFIVDGQWREDPRAAQRTANPHGEFNSVLTVPLAVRTSLL